jgi:hypothetical protein
LRTNDYGQWSIKLGDSTYKTFAAFVIPWLSKPYEYVSPYITKADSFGDKTLNSLDEHFPTVKKPTAELYNDIKGIILLPYHRGLGGLNHIFAGLLNRVQEERTAGPDRPLQSRRHYRRYH